MSTCPFCRRRMIAKPLEYDMAESLKPLYLRIQAAGRKGVSNHDLMREFFEGRSKVSLRTAIHRINLIISPIEIHSQGKTYRVEEKY